MEILDIVKICIGTLGLLGIFHLIFKLGRLCERIKGFKSDTENSFKSIDKHMEKATFERSNLHAELYAIRERITFLEAETIMYNTIPDGNTRSEAAKRSWARRKAQAVPKITKK